MIDPIRVAEINRLVREYWIAAVQDASFAVLASGKEIGHRIADTVDERTTELLHTRYVDSRYERDAAGRKRQRSMGDIWLQSNGLYHPVNVKTGEAGKNGQPNMVAMAKLLLSLLNHRIDSYYLLLVKFRLATPITCSVYFLDMLDYLDYLTFDSGPGQIMLKEREFYTAVDAGLTPPVRLPEEKVGQLVELMRDGDVRLARNREARRKKFEKLVEGYRAGPVLPDNQSEFRLA